MALQVSKLHPTLIEPGAGDALNTSALLLSQSGSKNFLRPFVRRIRIRTNEAENEYTCPRSASGDAKCEVLPVGKNRAVQSVSLLLRFRLRSDVFIFDKQFFALLPEKFRHRYAFYFSELFEFDNLFWVGCCCCYFHN